MEAMMTPIIGAIIVVISYYIYNKLVLQPKRLRCMLEKQGVRGPPPSSILLGNIPQILQMKSQLITPPSTNKPSHDWPLILFPHLHHWLNTYGGVFIYSTGRMQMLCVTDPNVIREITLCSSVDLGKPSYLAKERGPLLGEGIVSSSSSHWSYQRKIISPEFFPDKVKAMLDLMVEATTSLLSSWEERVNGSGGTAEITIDEDLRSLSADIISKAAFGSSYTQGKEIFSKLRALQKLMSKTVHVGIPFSRYIPTKNNREIKRLNKEINFMILKIVKERMREEHETDFLQKILEGANNSSGHADPVNIDHEKLIVDNCKTIYFAGHETTAITATWCLMLLAAFPEWQTRARAEVLENCGEGIIVADNLRNMKVLTMIIYETLRLYPPAVFVVRAALQDAKIKDIQVSKGTIFQIPVSLIHQNPDLWGPDAHEFNPERFANGISAACKNPQAYMPFGIGARTCLGQQFAMVELKAILSLILYKFSFLLSPDYVHCPAFRLVIEPEHGVKLFLKKA